MELCQGYEVSKYIHGVPTETSASSPTPFTPEENKVDTIVLSWIFTTILETLQARLVVEHPRSAKEAWDLITDIFKDNRRSHTIALKAKLRSIKLGDLTTDAYLRKIESLATILKTLGSPVRSDDVVTFALEGLPDKYDHVCGIITHREPFPDLKTAHSMLTTKDMRLRSKSLSLPMDSSSSYPLVLMADTGNSRRPSNSQVKSWRPCYNFAKGSCRFGDSCKYVHDAQAKSGNNSRVSHGQGSTSHDSDNNTHELLVKILQQLGNMGI
ncbi:hybrid signal transduction histidine kinase M [Tanacetum coccineum]